MTHRVCEVCGASLDYGEKCSCTENKNKDIENMENKEEITVEAVEVSDDDIINLEEIMKIEQKPIISQKLSEIKDGIREAVARVNAMEVTEDSVKEIKKELAKLNKDFELIEIRRKSIKNAIERPYKIFNEIYKENVTNEFESGIREIKAKVKNVEDKIKLDKETEVRKYFDELVQSKGYDFVTFEQTGIKILLSDKVTKYKKQVDAFVGNISCSLALIESQEHKADILVEFKKSLNINEAIIKVNAHYEAVKREKELTAQRDEILKKQQEHQAEIDKIVNETIEAPIVEPEPEEVPVQEKVQEPEQDVVPVEAEKLLKVNFSVIGTKSQLKELIRFMKERGLNYEQQ